MLPHSEEVQSRSKCPPAIALVDEHELTSALRGSIEHYSSRSHGDHQQQRHVHRGTRGRPKETFKRKERRKAFGYAPESANGDATDYDEDHDQAAEASDAAASGQDTQSATYRLVRLASPTTKKPPQ